jgi:hypothetical protein
MTGHIRRLTTAIVALLILASASFAAEWTAGDLTVLWEDSPDSTSAVNEQFDATTTGIYDPNMPAGTEWEYTTVDIAFEWEVEPASDGSVTARPREWENGGPGGTRCKSTADITFSVVSSQEGDKRVKVRAHVTGSILDYGEDGEKGTGDDVTYVIDEWSSWREEDLTVYSADTDGDGMPDDWEEENGLDPLDPTGDNGPEGDFDGDGHSNGFEREIGTEPDDAGSGLASGTVTIEIIGDMMNPWITVYDQGGTRQRFAQPPITLRWPYRVEEVFVNPQYHASVTDYEPQLDGDDYLEVFGACTITIDGNPVQATYVAVLDPSSGPTMIVYPVGDTIREAINQGRIIPLATGTIGDVSVEEVIEGPEGIGPDDVQITPGEVLGRAMLIDSNPVLTDVDMQISGDTFGDSDAQAAAPYMVDPDPGEVITVDVSVIGGLSSFPGDAANRVITLSWPEEGFVCTNPEGEDANTKEGVGAATYTWELERTNAALPEPPVPMIHASIDSIDYEHDEYEEIGSVTLGTDTEDDDIQVRPKAVADAAETTTLVSVEITAPKVESEVAELKDCWESTPTIRKQSQGVVLSAPGATETKSIGITGKIIPDPDTIEGFGYYWSISEAGQDDETPVTYRIDTAEGEAGERVKEASFAWPDAEGRNAIYSPAAQADTDNQGDPIPQQYTLSLAATADGAGKVSKTVTIFPDHLTRDEQNFAPFGPDTLRRCEPDIFVAQDDGDEDEGHKLVGTPLVCSSATVHAYNGSPVPGGWGEMKDAIEAHQNVDNWNQVQGWTEVEFETLDKYEREQLSRGDKIYVGGSRVIGIITHYQTAIEGGQDPQTYAADAASAPHPNYFRFETANEYYTHLEDIGSDVEDKDITVLKR